MIPWGFINIFSLTSFSSQEGRAFCVDLPPHFPTKAHSPYLPFPFSHHLYPAFSLFSFPLWSLFILLASAVTPCYIPIFLELELGNTMGRKEVSLYSKLKSLWKIKISYNTFPNVTSTTQLLHTRLKKHLQRGDRKIVRSRGPKSLLGDSVWHLETVF